MKREADTVVVIGTGPAGQVSGEKIDRYPVVRMWRHEWQPADRYGTRYDYGLITRSADVRLATSTPSKAWLFYNVPHETKPIDSGIAVFVLDHLRWYKRADALVPKAQSGSHKALKFTKGFAAIAGVIECLRPKRIIVVGMSILRDGMSGARYYDDAALPYYMQAYPHLTRIPGWASDNMPAGVLRDGPHDYAAESVLIRMLAAESEIELVWDVWSD